MFSLQGQKLSYLVISFIGTTGMTTTQVEIKLACP